MNLDELTKVCDIYLKYIPSPTEEQVLCLGKALGLKNTKIFAKIIKNTSLELKALTEDQKVMINDFNRTEVDTDSLLFIDGEEDSIDFNDSNVLDVDSPEDSTETDYDQRALTHDGV